MALASPARAADFGARCDAAQVKASARYCAKKVACRAKWVKKPSADPGELKRDGCIDKVEERFLASLAKADAAAAKKGASCSTEPAVVRGHAAGLADSVSAPVLEEWDSEAGNKADDRLRATLLKAGAKVCGKGLAAAAKNVMKPDDLKFERRLFKPLLAFGKASAKAIVKADKKGVDFPEQLPDAIASIVSSVATAAGVPNDPPTDEVFEITSGSDHSCLVRNNGGVKCWGRNDVGQALPPTGRAIPPIHTDWAGHDLSCAIREPSDAATCWGDDSTGQASPPKGDFEMVSAGRDHACGILADSTLACWGDPSDDKLAAPPGTFLHVSAGADHNCAIRTSDGTVACWGDDDQDEASPPGGVAFMQISAGTDYTCGIRDTDRLLQCWGMAPGGAPGGTLIQISSGETHACAVQTDTTVACWGDGDITPPASETFLSVAAGGRHTCGLRDDDLQVVCWGANDFGQSSCTGVLGCAGRVTPSCSLTDPSAATSIYESSTLEFHEVTGEADTYRLFFDDSALARLETFTDANPGELVAAESLIQLFDDQGTTCGGSSYVQFTLNDEDRDTFLFIVVSLAGPLAHILGDVFYEAISEIIYEAILAALLEVVLELIL